MTPQNSATRPPVLARVGALGVTGLGLLALAGCAATTDGASDTSASYADGTYSAAGGYTAPSGPEEVEVELTLEGDVVTAVTVTPTATDRQAVGFQTQFAEGISDVVVGKDID